jgi:pyruvate-formate lyase-activating enzyme
LWNPYLANHTLDNAYMLKPPNLLYADEKGNIFDLPDLFLAGSAGGALEPVSPDMCIPLPEGSELFLLPGRLPVGVDGHGDFSVVEDDPARPGRPVTAVAAFMAPAHTALLNTAFQSTPGAPNLPLFAYVPVGLSGGRFVVPAMRVDPSPRQDCDQFPPAQRIAAPARRLMRRYRNNRLWQHLGTCALTYCCPAARNLMLGRWEAPLPTSKACNASCLGCLNDQPPERFAKTQDRMSFTPDPKEVAQVAMHHFDNAKDPLVSFGQGCEGEPLLAGEVIAESVELMRKNLKQGTINLNTNGSLPHMVERIRRQGLSSIRVSLNSLVPKRHQTYYQPRGWSLSDAIESIKVMKQLGGFVSINLLCMPGLTDRPEEVKALKELISQTKLDMIQWRNLNIDPVYYLDALDLEPPEKRLGMDKLIQSLKQEFPRLRHGYFNPMLQNTAFR